MHKHLKVQCIGFKPTRADAKKGRWVLDDLDIPEVPGVKPARGAFVFIDPQGWAGNHKHRRHELLLGLAGELYLIWRDSKGVCHEEKMVPQGGGLRLYSIPPWVPHLVENRSASASGMLHEWSDIVDEAQDLEGEDSLRASRTQLV